MTPVLPSQMQKTKPLRGGRAERRETLVLKNIKWQRRVDPINK